MKNVLMYLFAITVLFSVISCEKDEFSQTQLDSVSENVENLNPKWLDLDLNNEEVNQGLKRKRCDFSSIKKVGKRLSFKNMDHFRKTLECLENQLEYHLDYFDQTYSHIPTNQLDAIADQISFDDWQPLIDFENHMNFSSRRKHVENKIVSWLEYNNSSLLSNDPDDLDDLDEEERTLLNIDGEVIIGGQVYNFLDGNTVTLTSSQNNGAFFALDACSYYSRNRQLIPYSLSRQFKLKIVLTSWPWKIKQKAKVVHFKRNTNGNWRRSRSVLTVQVQGLVRTDACTFPLAYGASKGPKRRKSLKCKRVNWEPPVFAKYKSEEGSASCTVEDGAFSGFVLAP